MTCDKYLELMSAALDGELTAEERRMLDRHLAVCPECAALYQNLSFQISSLRELDCEVPADLKQRIMSSLPEQEQPAKQGKVIHWKRWAPVAAAACLALVVALVPKDGMMRKNSAAPEMAMPAASSAPRTPGAAIAHDSASIAEAPAEAPPAADDTSYGEAISSYTPTVSPDNGSSEPEMGGLTSPEASEVPSEPSAAPSDTIAEETISPAEPDHCFFENQRSIRVSYGTTPAPGAVVIGSVESLEKYLAGFGSNAFDSQGNPIPNEKLESLKEVYNEEFFRTRRLLCVVVESGSGSNRYEIAGVLRDSVHVSMYTPEIGTCDMAAWLLVAEVDTMFDDGDTLETSIACSSQQSPLPIGTITHDLTISFRFENQRSIRIRSYERPEEGAVIIGSVESLNEYLNQFKSDIAEDLSEDLQHLQSDYGYDQFFTGECLLMIRVDTPSGGDRFRISDSGLVGDRVTLVQTEDGATHDEGYWLIVAEVSSLLFEDGDTLDVIFTR